jgi:hypothetical protein
VQSPATIVVGNVVRLRDRFGYGAESATLEAIAENC